MATILDRALAMNLKADTPLAFLTIEQLSSLLEGIPDNAPSINDKILDTYVDEFCFTGRLLNIFRQMDILRVKDILKHRRMDFIRMRNFGRKSSVELDTFLAEHNLPILR